MTNNTTKWLELSTSNDSEVSAITYNLFKVAAISPSSYVLAGCGLIFMMLALALNAFVLHAMRLNKGMKNNVKFLVRNSIYADMLLAVLSGTRALPVVVGNFIREDFLVPTMCLETLYSLLIGYSALTQTFSSIAVAVDRFVSVWRPLKYYTSDYSKLVRVFIICFTWVVSLAFATPSLWIDLAMGIIPLNGHACFVITLENAFVYYATVVPAIIWVSLISIVTIYLVIFAWIFALRKKSAKLNESNKETKLRQSSISMTITFLMVQLIYIACYLPGILMTMNLTPLEGVFPPVDVTLNLIIMDIYMLNSVVDPLIYIIRVQQVRECLMNYLDSNAKRPKAGQQSKITISRIKGYKFSDGDTGDSSHGDNKKSNVECLDE